MTKEASSGISAKILDAAEMRFQHYGYRKTTMAEIAGDADMSAANLYRYYTNKEDIGAACVLRCFQELEGTLRKVINRTELSATEKLQAFVLAKFEHVYNEVNNNTNINELVEMFVMEKTELLIVQKQGIQSLIAEILAQGNRSGEFSIEDIIVTSESINIAIVAFSFPMFMTLYSQEKFTQLANNMVNLLVHGLLPQKKP